MSNNTLWALFDPSGEFVRWAGANAKRSETIRLATEGCMGATTYHELGNQSDRWNHCYRRGYRVKRVVIASLPPHKGGVD